MIDLGVYPVGGLYARAFGGKIAGLYFADGLKAEGAEESLSNEDERVIEALKEWLGSYFACDFKRIGFDLEPAGTKFQVQVWRELEKLEFGELITYGEIADRMGLTSSLAARAVGQAVGANPLPILLPCHRVLGAGGRLTGYSGGLDKKKLLLEHEGFVIQGDKVKKP